jgi:hypothetical protein
MAKQPKVNNPKNPDPKQPGLFGGDANWQDQAGNAFQRFLRYGWDLLGVLLFAAAAILFLGSIGITQGALLRFFGAMAGPGTVPAGGCDDRRRPEGGALA